MFVANRVVDPTWDDVTLEARKRVRGIQGVVQRNLSAEAVDARVRRLRDEDIANADEGEIASAEKVLLLVSSSLNDRKNLPGYVYMHLIREHQNRERERRRSRWEEDVVGRANREDEKDGTYRTTREDTHAVIKHVMATLLEVRPGFGASVHITEMFATAVETLVFGEVYDSVFREIIEETREVDEALMIHISEFQIEIGRKLLSFDTGGDSSSDSSSSGPTMVTTAKAMAVPNCDIGEFVSDDALKSLRMLPESHSVAEKLYHCVQFLGFIASPSQFHSKASGKTKLKKTSIGTDSLLKMVCQHIIVAKVPNLNAEIFFLEEFVRDEQLLKGREGYALVTMQASLHFMNASTDFGKDIFHDEDD